jgi:FkbH-like protein
MVRVECPQSVSGYVLKITFKRWAKLWTPGNLRLRTIAQARRREDNDLIIGTILQRLPAPLTVRTFAVHKRYSLKKRQAKPVPAPDPQANCFLAECYNPNSFSVDFSLSIRQSGLRERIPFFERLNFPSGLSWVRVPVSNIEKTIDLSVPFDIELTPNTDTEALTLYFGLLDFVRETAKETPELRSKSESVGHSAKVKCIVWDLDNTLWDGILVEDGLEKLKLRPRIREVIEELDRRGILQSVASKNNYSEAIEALKHFGLDDFFLAPQISWDPKSEGIKTIAQELNIGVNSLLFVDDSEFELQQVMSILPSVRILNSEQYVQLPEMEECIVPVTDESRTRRKMYQVEEKRKTAAASFSDDYISFLRSCEIRMNITPLSEANLERVHELTQRTNQMNFSGTRYDRDLLRQIMRESHHDNYVIDVEDRFGTYGIVGFCVVDNRVPLIKDLMFSCRIQAKHIEHTLLTWLIRRYREPAPRDVFASYRKTDRNAPSGKVFADIGMKEIANVDGVSRLVFLADEPVADEGIVRVDHHLLSVVA